MTATQPRVSIVITCFNYGRYVREAIASALAQTYEHVEVVVVDDGSTDASPVVIRQFADRVKSIRQENQGHVPAFNRGFAESSGDLVFFLDADDMLYPDAARACVSAWAGDTAKVQFDLDHIDADGGQLRLAVHGFDASYTRRRVRRSFERSGTYQWPVTVGNAYSRWFLQSLVPLRVALGPDEFLNTVAPVFGEVVTDPQPRLLPIAWQQYLVLGR